MAHPTRLLVFAPLGEVHLAALRAVDPRVEVEATTDRRRAAEIAPAIDVLSGWRVPDEVVGRAGRLRWYHSLAAGVDHMLDTLGPDVVMTTSSGIHAVPISEHVMGMMLMWVRRLHVAARNQLARTWDRNAVIGEELYGRTLGVLGLGNIGRDVARRAIAFGMRVIGTRHRPEPVEGVERVLPPHETGAVLAESDIVVIALPLTPATRGLVGQAELRAMKPTAFLVNIGRGEIVDEEALVRALREGWIAGAGLDVFAQEPLPQSSPLWTMPNVIITPHVSGDSPQYLDRAVPILADNLRRYVAGEPMRNLVDRERGY